MSQVNEIIKKKDDFETEFKDIYNTKGEEFLKTYCERSHTAKAKEINRAKNIGFTVAKQFMLTPQNFSRVLGERSLLQKGGVFLTMGNEQEDSRKMFKTKEDIYGEGIDRKKLPSLKMPMRSSGTFFKMNYY